MSKAYKHRNINDLLHYNGLDTVATARAYNEMLAEPEWQEPRVKRLWEVHTRLAKIAAKMHDRGFKINEETRQKLSQELTVMHEERKLSLLQAVNDKEFGATPDDMRALVYKRHAIVGRKSFNLEDPPEYKRDMWVEGSMESGKCSVGKAALLHHYVDVGVPQELRDIIRFYWECHAPRKAKATYIDGEKVLNAIGRDGRLRPGWNSCGTETMRWSCSSPNLMNLSEEKDETELNGYLPNMRQMYEAGDGMVLVHADASQQELRFNVPITNDTDLEKALSTGDVYSYDAAQVFGDLFTQDTNEKRRKQTRKQIKIVHLAFQYAAGTPAVYTQALVRDRSLTYSKVKAFHNKLKSIYVGTVRYWETELKKVMSYGYSEGLILGTRIYYPSPPAITETANKPIQTTAAESMACAMLRIEDRLAAEVPSAYFVNILHDAFDVECEEEDVYKVISILHEEMEGPWRLSNGKSVFVPVEHKVNKNWGKV